MRNGAWLGQVPIATLGVNAAGDADLGVLTSAQAVVVECWQPGCVPCEQYKPTFDAVAVSVPQGVLMVSVNVAAAPQFASRYQIEATPTTLFLSSGNEVNRIEGKPAREELVAAIQSSFGIQLSTPVQGPPLPPAPTPKPQTTQQQPGIPPVQYPGPSSTGVMVGIVAIALGVAGLAVIFGRKKKD